MANWELAIYQMKTISDLKARLINSVEIISTGIYLLYVKSDSERCGMFKIERLFSNQKHWSH